MDHVTTTEGMQVSSSAYLKNLQRAGRLRDRVEPSIRALPNMRPGSVSKSLIADVDEEREIK